MRNLFKRLGKVGTIVTAVVGVIAVTGSAAAAFMLLDNYAETTKTAYNPTRPAVAVTIVDNLYPGSASDVSVVVTNNADVPITLERFKVALAGSRPSYVNVSDVNVDQYSENYQLEQNAGKCTYILNGVTGGNGVNLGIADVDNVLIAPGASVTVNLPGLISQHEGDRGTCDAFVGVTAQARVGS